MTEDKMIDHLFRHQYGKMVSILTRIFGLRHLETIEDAVQDTFVTAMLKWRQQIPDNPEAWLTQAAKNRAIDLLRKIKADNDRLDKLNSGQAAMAIHNLFLDHEVADSQLRMIFTACHPKLNPKDQIAFALKTISGFSTKEIASALLTKEDSIKKRLSRARKSIQEHGIQFQYPDKKDVPRRLNRVLEVIYLIFNEGFHSGRKDMIIRKDLCGEALRLCKIILKKPLFRSGNAYALFALMCFHASRLEARVDEWNEIIDLKHQDRSKWHRPLMALGNDAMHKACEYEEISTYHIEATIAFEHLKAKSFEQTDWKAILDLYEALYQREASPFILLNKAMVLLQLEDFDQARELLHQIKPGDFEQRAYLYHGTWAEYYKKTKQIPKAIAAYDQALNIVHNASEKRYLTRKKQALTDYKHSSS